MKRFKSKEHKSPEMILQITSMADVFTVLIVFLLKSFSLGVTSLSPNANLKLPEIVESSHRTIKDAPTLEITSDHVLIDQEMVQSSDLLEKLGQSLKNYLAKTGRNLSSEINEHPLLVLADRNIRYADIYPILAKASEAGFMQIELVVVNSE